MVTDSLGYQAIPMGFTGRRFLKNARPAFNWGVRARHSSSIMLKPAENRFNQSDFTSILMQGSANLYNFRFRQYSKFVELLYVLPISQKRCKNLFSSLYELFFLPKS